MTYFFYPQTSSKSSLTKDCFLIRLSYLGFGNLTPLDLNLLGSKGFLRWSDYVSTTKGETNFYLTF